MVANFKGVKLILGLLGIYDISFLKCDIQEQKSGIRKLRNRAAGYAVTDLFTKEHFRHKLI